MRRKDSNDSKYSIYINKHFNYNALRSVKNNYEGAKAKIVENKLRYKQFSAFAYTSE